MGNTASQKIQLISPPRDPVKSTKCDKSAQSHRAQVQLRRAQVDDLVSTGVETIATLIFADEELENICRDFVRGGPCSSADKGTLEFLYRDVDDCLDGERKGVVCKIIDGTSQKKSNAPNDEFGTPPCFEVEAWCENKIVKLSYIKYVYESDKTTKTVYLCNSHSFRCSFEGVQICLKKNFRADKWGDLFFRKGVLPDFFYNEEMQSI